MEAVAHQCKHDVGMGVLAEQLGLFLAKAGQVGAKKYRVQWCDFELEANRSVDGLGIQEMVRVNGLRCTVPRGHIVGHDGRSDGHRVQKGARAQAFVRVRGAST